MAGLSSAHRSMLVAVLERCSEPMLKTVATAVAPLPGERADDLRALLADIGRDRARRTRVMGPIAPLFRPRPDGLKALTFPAAVLDRLWKIAGAKEARLLPHLDARDDPRAGAVIDRLYQAAAAAVRDQPDTVWPPTGDTATRADDLADLAACIDLAPLLRRGLPTLEIWLKRPDGEQVAELRLLLKDSAAVHADGAQRVLEMLFAHLDDAVLILRILTQASSAAEQEDFLCESEMAGFVDRLIAGVQLRAARIAAFKPGPDPAGVEQAAADLTWCAGVLGELDVTLTLNPLSVWGKSVRDGRVAIAGRLAALFRSADKAVGVALPLTSVKTSGRMTRMVPMLEAPARGEAAEAALSLLNLVGRVRDAASTFGCEADRRALVEALTTRLIDYVDQALHMIGDGEASDDDHVLKLIAVAARYLDMIDARDAARAVRRRAAAACGSTSDVRASSQAA